ncbi:glycoside hydrolase family 25 protein [Streptomyces sp. 8L]|uniref:glycoside hydrolase family 25 protein n=1 Tax=Streptomyces sp. 8L TaxID=2877242 RepID=UPI001CD469EF|nr:glycoside hydrolase family 25 protein [Streptomyces sp. 8L]MCA1220241.1 glycoside hydrolase family 25 protein [Streptomyces sp. 8L]
MATCRGIDVSAYQATQDWAAHKKDGVVFAFAKASEGQTTHDSRFSTHIKGIKAAGLVPGAYHFAWPSQDVAKEAANYIAAVKPYAGKGFTHWLDLERYSDGRNYAGRTAAQIKAYATAWIAAVSKAFPGQRVGVYTSGSDLSSGHVPSGVPLWYPAYSWGSGTSVSYATAEAHAKPKPSGWTPILWQFADAPTDRSICYMTEAQLRTWAGGDTPVTPDAPPPEDDMPKYVNLGVSKPYQLKPGADWDAIEFNAEWDDQTGDHATGGSVFVKGKAVYNGTIWLRFSDLAVGQVVQVRQSEVDANGKYVHDHPASEVIGTGGDTFAAVPLGGSVAAGRSMRIRMISQQAKTPVTVAGVTLMAFVWK